MFSPIMMLNTQLDLSKNIPPLHQKKKKNEGQKHANNQCLIKKHNTTQKERKSTN